MIPRAAVLILLLLALLPPSGRADVGPPAHLQLQELEDGLFRVQWRVPGTLPPRAVPTPDLPEDCGVLDEPLVTRVSSAWLFEAEWRCEEGVTGKTLGLHFPFGEYALTTVIRVELLSGDRFAHMWSPGEETWIVPEGTAAPDVLDEARRSVLVGMEHAPRTWLHLLFLFVLVALGSAKGMLRLVTAFSLGQVLGVVVAGFLPWFIGDGYELAFALVLVLLAAQALRRAEDRSQLTALCALAGVVHGSGIPGLLAVSGLPSGLIGGLLVVLGMDAVHLGGGLLLAAGQAQLAKHGDPGAIHRSSLRLVGVVAFAAALSLAWNAGADGSGSGEEIYAPALTGPDATATAPASQRIASAASTAAVQSFLVVEPFEVRHEVLVRVAALAGELELDLDEVIPVEEQAMVRDAIVRWVRTTAWVGIHEADERLVLEVVDGGFMSVDPTGVLPRVEPVEEDLFEAVVGVVIRHPVPGMPSAVDLLWKEWPERLGTIPHATIDPETVQNQELEAGPVQIRWDNRLLEDPIPQVESVPVEPRRLAIPWLSLPLCGVALMLLVARIRGRRDSVLLTAAPRILLALAVLVGPWMESSFALGGGTGRIPDERGARRILAGLIPNVYRAIEYRTEDLIYDRLGVSVTGESLTEVYLQQRNALELEERGGARARVQSVEILEASDITSVDRGFGTRAEWTVGGMVTHFGHRHFRQNRYRARVEVIAVDGSWKIQAIEVLEQDRLR